MRIVELLGKSGVDTKQERSMSQILYMLLRPGVEKYEGISQKDDKSRTQLLLRESAMKSHPKPLQPLPRRAVS
jgi:hypothetical protein